MKIFEKAEHASIQLSKQEKVAVLNFVHNELPYDLELVSTGKGWYKMFTLRNITKINVVRFGVMLIRKAIKQYQAWVISEIKRLLPPPAPRIINQVEGLANRWGARRLILEV